MGLLLRILLDEELDVSPTVAEWQETLALAEEENVLPFSVRAIRRASPALPETITALLDQIDRAHALSLFWWRSELSGILAAFGRIRIPVILVKGPLLAQRLCGDPGLRTLRDLDLLVRRADWRVATDLLRELGFNAVSRPDEYQQGFRRGSTLVELHHNLENPLSYRVDLQGLWSRAKEVRFGAECVYQFSAPDELLLLCLHGARHRYERLSHVLDVALGFEHLAPQVKAEETFAGFAGCLRPLLLLGYAVAKRLRPNLTLSLVSPSPSEFAHMEGLASKRWEALQQELSVPLDWQAQHRFYLELEVTSAARFWRSSRHLVILSTRLIQSDFDFAGRFHITKTPLVWMARQVRLAGRATGIHRPLVRR